MLSFCQGKRGALLPIKPRFNAPSGRRGTGGSKYLFGWQMFPYDSFQVTGFKWLWQIVCEAPADEHLPKTAPLLRSFTVA